MNNPTPFLWINGSPAEAADFYLDVFADSEKLFEMPGADGPMGVTLRIKQLDIVFFNNGGSVGSLDMATSLMMKCADQAEIDHLWERLAEGGEHSQCGWLTDRFGVSWQVMPENMLDLTMGNDPEGAKRATDAMMGMTKLIVADLEAAYAGS